METNKAQPTETPEEKPIAITVRLAPALFRRMKHHGIDAGKSTQQMLVEALSEYLK